VFSKLDNGLHRGNQTNKRDCIKLRKRKHSKGRTSWKCRKCGAFSVQRRRKYRSHLWCGKYRWEKDFPDINVSESSVGVYLYFHRFYFLDSFSTRIFGSPSFQTRVSNITFLFGTLPARRRPCVSCPVLPRSRILNPAR
jgi:hypothetical protein